MNNIYALLIYISFTFLYGSIQVSQESNLAFGKLLNTPFPNNSIDSLTTDYKINENLINIGYSNNHLNIFAQLEYSDPPVFGETKISTNNFLNSYHLEYLNKKFHLKLGNIYSTYTRGLMFNTYQDQSTDFDNSLLGLDIIYNHSEQIKLYTILGSDTYEFRTKPDNQLTDLSIAQKTIFMGSEYSGFRDFILNV
ncbi:uncharacterized protein METZ01_LOCUS489004, partial [marine metagenome]